MNESIENAFVVLGLSDGDTDDTFTPEGKPYTPIGRASRRHSCLEYPDPTDRFSDEEAVHLDTINPSGKALIYDDPGSDEESYLPLVVRGTPRVGPSYPSVLRGELAMLITAIMLDKHGCRSVGHYTPVLVKDQ